MKIYKLLQESPLYPLGTTAKQNEAGSYDIYINNNSTFDDLEAFQIEDRPNIWELQEEKKEEVNEYLPFIPQLGEKYYFIDHQGNIQSDTNENHHIDTRLIAQGVYRTERAVRMEVLRRKSMAKRIVVSEGGKYFYVHLYQGDICDAYKEDSVEWEFRFMIGNIHKSTEDAQKWKDDGYWEAFNCLF